MKKKETVLSKTKFKFKKFQISKLNNLHAVKGGGQPSLDGTGQPGADDDDDNNGTGDNGIGGNGG